MVSNTGKIHYSSCYSQLLQPVYTLYSKNVKVYIVTLLLILQSMVGSLVMQQVTHISMFNFYCDKMTLLIEIGLLGCMFLVSFESSFYNLFVLRGTIVMAHAALWLHC